MSRFSVFDVFGIKAPGSNSIVRILGRLLTKMHCQCLIVQVLALVMPVLSLDCDATGMLQSSSERQKQDMPAASHREDAEKSMVFYNLYVGTVEDIPVVSEFVKAQLPKHDAS